MAKTTTPPLDLSTKEFSDRINGAPVRPDAPDDGLYVSKEDYWANYYEGSDTSYEWNNGYLEAKPLPNEIELSLYHWFFRILNQFLEVHPIAKLINLETGFSMTISDPNVAGKMKETVRKPDIGVIRNDNSTPWGGKARSYAGICDLCIESVSDSSKQDVERDTEIKKYEYAAAGVQEYYILDPSGKNQHFYQRNAAGAYVEITPSGDGIIRSKVLPGLQFRIEDLRQQPKLEEMALDEIYQGFILLDYQASLARIEAETAARKAVEEELARVQAELDRLRKSAT